MPKSRNRRNPRRGDSTAAVFFMVCLAGVLVVARVWPVLQHRLFLAGVVIVCCAAVVLVGIGLRIRFHRRVRAQDELRVLAALRQNALNPTEFEHALAALCRRDGCRDVRVVGGSGDLGADVLARTPDNLRVVLQAKRYRNGSKVGSQDVQRFGVLTEPISTSLQVIGSF